MSSGDASLARPGRSTGRQEVEKSGPYGFPPEPGRAIVVDDYLQNGDGNILEFFWQPPLRKRLPCLRRR
jgi:hypothetical protein